MSQDSKVLYKGLVIEPLLDHRLKIEVLLIIKYSPHLKYHADFKERRIKIKNSKTSICLDSKCTPHTDFVLTIHIIR